MAKYEPKKHIKNADLHLDREAYSSKNKRNSLYSDNADKTPKKRLVDTEAAYEEISYFSVEDIDLDGIPERKKKMSGGKKALIAIVIILVILIGGGLLALNFLMQPSKKVDLDRSKLGITEGLNDANVEKLLLFGIDGDENYSGGRSDTIIIAAINKKTKKIKLISILRDTRVVLDDFGTQKINAAYAYGGPVLAINTVNRNFKQDIKDFISVDFSRLAEIVDMVGGIDIEITAEEAEQINIFCPDREYVSAGHAHLCGEQAVAFSRIRSIDSDYERASRQQKVINAIFSQARSLSLTEYPIFIKDLFSTVETSLGMTDALRMALLYRSYDVENHTVPDPDYENDLWGGIDENGMWVWIYDLDAAAERIRNVITE